MLQYRITSRYRTIKSIGRDSRMEMKKNSLIFNSLYIIIFSLSFLPESPFQYSIHEPSQINIPLISCDIWYIQEIFSIPLPPPGSAQVPVRTILNPARISIHMNTVPKQIGSSSWYAGSNATVPKDTDKSKASDEVREWEWKRILTFLVHHISFSLPYFPPLFATISFPVLYSWTITLNIHLIFCRISKRYLISPPFLLFTGQVPLTITYFKPHASLSIHVDTPQQQVTLSQSLKLHALHRDTLALMLEYYLKTPNNQNTCSRQTACSSSWYAGSNARGPPKDTEKSKASDEVRG